MTTQIHELKRVRRTDDNQNLTHKPTVRQYHETMWFETPVPAHITIHNPLQPYEFFPFILLYLGPLMGPLAPTLFAALLLRHRFRWHLLLTLIFACLATWLLIQGIGLFFTTQFSGHTHQLIRTSINLLFALFAYFYIHLETRKVLIYSQRVLIHSVILILTTALLTLLLPRTWWSWLGR